MSIPSIEQARRAVTKKNFKEAEEIYHEILSIDPKTSSLKHEKVVELQEAAILELGELYKNENDSEKLVTLISKARNIMSSFAKSKTAKVIKSLIDLLEQVKTANSIDLTIQVTKECIDWAIEEKRTFLRQSLQSRLAELYYKKHNFQDSLAILEKLLKELKKLDDKSSLVEVQLLESKNFFQLKNFSKARGSLTASRTSANAIYCPTQLQAELDLMSGILHAEDKDFKTSFSYFYESFENYELHPDNSDFKTIKVLKYMLLCKIMLGTVEEVDSILKNKNCSKYQDNKEIEAMKSVASAYSERSLKELEKSLKVYNHELTDDLIIRSHLTDLYDSLFQQNLLKLIEPYSCIEISHICAMIGLSKNIIESKLSNMILDKVFYGVIDQGNGWLIIYDEPQKDETYDLSLDVIKNMSTVVDLLYEKASSLD